MRSDLLILEFLSAAVFAPVLLFFMPHMREQKDLRLPALLPLGLDSVTGAASLLPGLAALYDALPFALSPPLEFCPAFLVQAAPLLYCRLLVLK